MSTPETAAPVVRCWWMEVILETKKDMSELQKSEECKCLGRESGGLVMLDRREKRVFELCWLEWMRPE